MARKFLAAWIGIPLLFSAVLWLPACMTRWFGEQAGYDARILKVQTVSLFNQRSISRLADKNWKGDWIFRRDRLDLVDAELRNAKPDLLIIQELMAKQGGSAESDMRILGAGALTDYEWRNEVVESYDDTQEQQSLAVAVTLPSRLAPAESEPEMWRLGGNGYMMVATMEYQDQPVTIINVQMPSHGQDNAMWYGFIQERVQERLKRLNLCAKRLVLAGSVPGDASSKRFSELLLALHLKDSSTGYCQMASRCYTATPSNEIYLATEGDENPTRVDKIFVHNSSIVYTSARNFEGSDANNRYIKQYGLTRLFPTQRFGWSGALRLARCSSSELGI